MINGSITALHITNGANIVTIIVFLLQYKSGTPQKATINVIPNVSLW